MTNNGIFSVIDGKVGETKIIPTDNTFLYLTVCFLNVIIQYEVYYQTRECICSQFLNKIKRRRAGRKKLAPKQSIC